MSQIVMQTAGDGKYSSELINDRFQILESWLYDDKYYIYDHKTEDNIVDSQQSTMLFSTKEVALNYIQTLSNNKVASSGKAGSRIKTAAMRVKKQSSRGESALSYLKELIQTTDWDDNSIAISVRERFPTSNYNHSMVKYNRKKLVAS